MKSDKHGLWKHDPSSLSNNLALSSARDPVTLAELVCKMVSRIWEMHEHLETPGRNLFQIYHSLFYTTSNFPQLLFTDFTDLILVSLRFEKQLVQRPCRTSCGRTTLRLLMFGEPIRKQNISWSDLVHLFSQGWRRPQHTHTNQILWIQWMYMLYTQIYPNDSFDIPPF